MVNSYRYAFAATTPDLPTSGTTVDLGIGQIGIFDAKTWVATATPKSKSIVITQGTPDTKWIPGVAKGNQTYKSLTIKGNIGNIIFPQPLSLNPNFCYNWGINSNERCLKQK